MSIRTLATLAVAVFLGLIAVLLVRGYLNSARRTQVTVATAVGGTPVVVAATPIARGAPLQAAMFKVARYPADAQPAGSFSNIGQLTGGRPRIALRALQANEPILLPSISGPGGRLNLSGGLTQGQRAISIRSNDVTGVGGFVLPGDRVDVLLTRAVGSGGGQQTSVTQVIADNVRVMAVDQSDDPGADKPVVTRTITVEVTPAEAQTISLGQSVGSVTLSLRQAADEAPLGRRTTTLADLGPVGAPAPAAPPAAGTTAKPGQPAAVPLHGPGVVRVTRGVDTTGYQVGAP